MMCRKFPEGTMKRHLGFIAAACALGCAASGMAASAGSNGDAAGRPALWRSYDIIVDLQKLPRTYTCDQLWYEFRGILLRLGAWPYSISILPYHCSPTPSGYMRSPDVEVRFQLPIFLAAGVKPAPAEAVERKIRLAPGEPATLQPADCALLQQIEQALLATVATRVDEERFDCSAPPRRAAEFNVTLSLPVAVKMPPAPTTAAAAPR